MKFVTNFKMSTLNFFPNLKPSTNFLIAFISITLCLLPKLFCFSDSFNIPNSNYTFDKESMKTSALLLLISAAPTAFDFFLDIIYAHHNLKKDQELKSALNITSSAFIVVALDILAKLDYFPIHISPSHFHLSFEFLVWSLRLITTASLMFVASTRSPDIYPTWKTAIVTLSVASYGLLRYVLPFHGNIGTVFYQICFVFRSVLISCVHYMYCVWVYKITTLRKWTVNDYGIFFNLCVFTLLTLDFIKTGIYKVFFMSAYSAVVNLDRLKVERTMVDLVIAQIMFSVIPGRLAKIEMMEHKDTNIESRKAFVRYISHELRTPLNTVFSGIKLAIKQYKIYEESTKSRLKTFNFQDDNVIQRNDGGLVTSGHNQYHSYTISTGTQASSTSVMASSSTSSTRAHRSLSFTGDAVAKELITSNHDVQLQSSEDMGYNCKSPHMMMDLTSSHTSKSSKSLSRQMSHKSGGGGGGRSRSASICSNMSTTSNEDERLEILQEISLACGVAVEILNEFLMFDKLEQDTLALNKQEVSVIDFATSSIKMIFVQIREKNIKLVLVNYLPVGASAAAAAAGVGGGGVVHSNKYGLGLSAHEKKNRNTNNTNAITDEFHNNKNHDNCGEEYQSEGSLLFFPSQKLSHKLHEGPLENKNRALKLDNYDERCYIMENDVINIDKHKLDQVMRNLLSNAIKFTPEGGKITVEIKFKPDKKQDIGTNDENNLKGSLVVKVSDTGAGISVHDQKKLFKEVVQFRPHELQAGGGSGLGLFITKGIVDLHGGSISVSSPGEGLGSTFTLKMPMIRKCNKNNFQPASANHSTKSKCSESSESKDTFDDTKILFTLGKSNSNGCLSYKKNSMLRKNKNGSPTNSSVTLPCLASLPHPSPQPHTNNVFDLKSLRKQSTVSVAQKFSQYEELLTKANTPHYKQMLMQLQNTEPMDRNDSTDDLSCSSASSMRWMREEDMDEECTTLSCSPQSGSVVHSCTDLTTVTATLTPPEPTQSTYTLNLPSSNLSTRRSDGGCTDGVDEHCPTTYIIDRVDLSSPEIVTTCSTESTSTLVVDNKGSINHIPLLPLIPSLPTPNTTPLLPTPNVTPLLPLLFSTSHDDMSIPVTVRDSAISNEEDYDSAAYTAESHHSLRFLVVDDSGMNRKMMSRMLRTEGYLVNDAEDGLKAVDMIKLHKIDYYDVLLMDSHMPNMDGPKATSVIRSMGYQGIILGITGDTAVRDLDYFSHQGASRVLTKPVDVDTIIDTIQDIKSF